MLANFYQTRLHARWGPSPTRSWASSARLHCQRVHPSKESHPANLRNLNWIYLDQHDTENTASAGCALVWGFCFSRVAAPLNAASLLQSQGFATWTPHRAAEWTPWIVPGGPYYIKMNHLNFYDSGNVYFPMLSTTLSGVSQRPY